MFIVGNDLPPVEPGVGFVHDPFKAMGFGKMGPSIQGRKLDELQKRFDPQGTRTDRVLIKVRFEEPFFRIYCFDSSDETEPLGTAVRKKDFDSVDHTKGFCRHGQRRRGIRIRVFGKEGRLIFENDGSVMPDLIQRRRECLFVGVSDADLLFQGLAGEKTEIGVPFINGSGTLRNPEIKMFDDHFRRFGDFGHPGAYGQRLFLGENHSMQ